MRVLLALALVQAVGYLTLRALAGQQSQRRLLDLWSLSFGAGSGILSLGMFYFAYWGIPLSQTNLLIGTAVLLGSLMVLWSVRARPGHKSPVSSLGSSHTVETLPLGRSLSPLEWISLAVVGLCVFLVLADALSQPLLAFDARAIWAFKAKVLCFEQGIYNEAFLQAERLHAKTRYPQLIPLTEAFIASASGGFHETAIKLLFPCFYVSLIMLVGSELSRAFDRRYALLCTGLFASLPVFTIYANGGAASGYADLPLAFYITALATRLLRWLQEGSAGSLRLALLFTSLTVFTKTEGLALVFIVFLATALAAWLLYGRRVRSLWPLPVTALGGLICLAPWFLYQAQLPVMDEDFVKLLTPENLVGGINRLPYILRSLGKEFLLKPHLWSVLGISATALFLRSPRNAFRSRFSIFLWIPLLYVTVLCAIFMVIPWKLEELFPVVLTRLVMHTAPLLFLWICFELGGSGLLAGCTGPFAHIHPESKAESGGASPAE
jgi:hypothetical protein